MRFGVQWRRGRVEFEPHLFASEVGLLTATVPSSHFVQLSTLALATAIIEV